MICKKCRKEMEKEWTSCPYCGEKQGEDEIKKQVGKKKVGCLTYVIIAIALLFFLSLFSGDVGDSAQEPEYTDSEHEEYTIEDYLNDCNVVTFEEIARKPELYIGTDIIIEGRFAETFGVLSIGLWTSVNPITIEYDGEAYNEDLQPIGKVLGTDYGYVAGKLVEDNKIQAEIVIVSEIKGLFGEEYSTEAETEIESKTELESESTNIIVSGNIYQDAENGLLYSNEAGFITDKKGNVLAEYKDLMVLENGAISDGESILEALYAGAGGKIVLDIPGEVEDNDSEISCIEGLVPRSGTYRNANSPFYFIISEEVYGNEYTETFIYVTIYCGMNGEEYQQEYLGMINLYDPGMMTIQTGVQSAAYMEYDVESGTLSGGVKTLVNDYTERHRYYYMNKYGYDYYEDNETREYFLSE
ncbi:MAG: hypothetical protein J6B96_08130 [Agathobacter sp.]|nr:hypothetical protein [Agathobacter sp.]